VGRRCGADLPIAAVVDSVVVEGIDLDVLHPLVGSRARSSRLLVVILVVGSILLGLDSLVEWGGIATVEGPWSRPWLCSSIPVLLRWYRG
jgi:hypothetical protein